MKSARAAQPRKRQGRLRIVDPSDKDAVCDDRLRSFADRYYAWMEVTHYSPGTMRSSTWRLEKFLEWCEVRSVERIEEVTTGIVEAYQRYIFEYRNPKSQKPLGATSQRGMLAIVRVFFDWLIRKRFITTNPASTLDLPRAPFKLPKSVFTLEEIEKVLGTIDVNSPLGLRDRTIIEVIYSSGIRRFEASALKIRDMDLVRGLVKIMGKGRRERVVPIGERAVEWVKRYLAESRPQLVGGRTDPEFLFITCNGNRVSVDQLSKIARTMIEAAKVEKGGACHAFRHSFATHLLDNDTDIRHIQAMLGHKDISSTTIYTHVALKKLKEIHSAKHPAASGEAKGSARPVRRRTRKLPGSGPQK